MVDSSSLKMNASTSIGQFVGIQYLRGIAALMVVIFHLEPQLNRMNYSGPWLPGLSSGIDIFFVISGFIMWTTTYNRSTSPLHFWRRRVIRIVHLDLIPGGWTPFGLFTVVACSIAGVIIYMAVEKPLISLFRARGAPTRVRGAAA